MNNEDNNQRLDGENKINYLMRILREDSLLLHFTEEKIYVLKDSVLKEEVNSPITIENERKGFISLFNIIYFFYCKKIYDEDMESLFTRLKLGSFAIFSLDTKTYIALTVPAIKLMPELFPLFIIGLEDILDEKYELLSDIFKEIDQKEYAINLVKLGLIYELRKNFYLLSISDYSDVCLQILKKEDSIAFFEFIDFLKLLCEEKDRGKDIYINKLSIFIENIFQLGHGADVLAILDYLFKLKPEVEDINDSDKYYNQENGLLYKNIIFDSLKELNYNPPKSYIKNIPSYLHSDVILKIIDNKNENYLLHSIDNFSFPIEQKNKVKDVILSYWDCDSLSPRYEEMMKQKRKKIINILQIKKNKTTNTNKNNEGLIDANKISDNLNNITTRKGLINKLENILGLMFVLFWVYAFIWGFPEINKHEDGGLNTKIETDKKLTIISVKYRDDIIKVDDSVFEYLKIEGQDTVRQAWYDKYNKYFIVNLNGINYHYCDFPEKPWLDFKKSSEKYIFYRNNIYGQYDCRLSDVPKY